MAKIDSLLSALQGEVQRITDEKASLDRSEELAEVFLEAIHKTLRDIKLGADSDDFPDLTVINFVLLAAEKEFDVRSISSFVKALKEGPEESF